MDTDPDWIDSVMTGEQSKLFDPDSYFAGYESTHNNYSIGRYTFGGMMIDSVMDIIRKKVESWDKLLSFQVWNSTNGGTGSGFGSWLFEQLKDSYAEKITEWYSVFPTESVYNVPLEYYNATLGFNLLIENTDFVACFDNNSLYNISHKLCSKSTPNFQTLNTMIATQMSSTSSTVRFHGSVSTSIQKMLLNWCPFPRIHFYAMSYTPFVPLISTRIEPQLTAKEMIHELVQGHNMMCKFDTSNRRALTSYAIFRGSMSELDIEISISNIINA